MVISFFDWNLMGSPRFVGLANHREMTGDSEVWRSVRNTLYHVVLNIPAQTVPALLLALAMNRRLKGGKVFRVLFVLPWMAMPVALGIVWSWAFDPQHGVINPFLSLFGVDGPAWLSSTTWAMPVMASVNIWQYTGYAMLFLLAAPDVFWDHVAYFPQFAQQGVRTDLTPYIKGDRLDTSIYDTKLLAGWQQDGKQYGLPKDWDTIARIYNRTMLKTAGLTQDQLGGTSWNTGDGGTFVKALQKLTIDANGKHPNEAGFDAKHVKQYGLALSSPNGQTDRWDAATPPNGAAPPQVMARRQAAVVWDGSWDLNAYQSSMMGDFGVAELPGGPVGKGTVYNGLSNALYAGSKHPKEAGGTTIGYPLTTSSATYNVKVQDAFNQVWLGQQSPRKAADSVNEESNAAIK
ncbi:extracellular solute-binding protein [Streptomyces fuscichromogenes]|uniref:Uncharacterized protein n=1 Tax=Streptomyces fuscichromogenes TaxID=1324013 RepID=A0A918CPH4_9ACTN|nr:extracellular solute-binding protein [Streptomyces fuscichromogenes]GGN00615.1 hypothetical protein GCM10011578_022310 [Streptomyces fuscichromogenes]